MPGLQAGGQIVEFLHHLGCPIPSPAAPSARRSSDTPCPWITFGKGDRKIEVMRPLLEAAELEGTSKVVAIGVAQEYQWVYQASAEPTSNGIPWFDYSRTERRVTCF